MLHNLLFLRPSIEGVSLTTENIIFKLLYAISTPTFLAFGVIFYTRVCFTDPINCITNSSESFKVLRAIDSYCLENSYLNQGKDDILNLGYYQYVGLFFALCGALTYLPYILWEWFENGRLKSILQDLSSITLITAQDKEETKRMKDQIQKLVSILKRNGSMLETYAWANVFCEICNFLVLLTIFALGDWFLGGYFLNLGGRNAFPKVAKCTWDTGIVLYEGVCTMNMNYLSEKLFFFAWWWLTTCLALSLLNLTYRYALVRLVEFRTWTMMGYHLLSPRTKEQDNRLLKHVPCLEQIGYGEFFMLKRIQANVPPFTFAKILQELSQWAKVDEKGDDKKDE